MKKILKTNTIFVLLLSIVFLASCKKKFDDNYTPYTPTKLTVESVGLNYNPNIINTDTNVVKIVSDTPTLKISDLHVFGIDTAYHSAGTEGSPGFSYYKLSINSNTGVITYNNSNGNLKPGTITIDVTVGGLTNYVTVKGALKIEVSGK